MDETNKQLLAKIRQHLAKLHTEWTNDPESDGHHKSSEGYIAVFMYYPNWFEAKDYLTDSPEIGCEIYSYLFGPSRLHEYDSLREAWNEVKTWKYK